MNARKTSLGALGCIFFIALCVRFTPALSTGLPYNYDCWEGMARVAAVLSSGSFDKMPPHGPLFYSLVVTMCTLFGSPPIDVFTYTMPVICSTVVFSVFSLAKAGLSDRTAAVYAALLAAACGIFVHQTSYGIPEALALTYTAFVIYLLYGAIRSDLRKSGLLLMSCAALLLTHHLTTLLLLIGLGLLSLAVLLTAKRVRFSLYIPVFLVIAFFLIVFSFWATAIPATTFGFMHLILATAPEASVLGVVLAGTFVAFGCALVFKWRPAPPSKKKLIGGTSGFTVFVTLIFALLIMIMVPSASPYSVDPAVLGFYIFPYGLLLFFPGLVGLYSFFGGVRDALKRAYTLVWAGAPLASAIFLSVFSYWSILAYRNIAFLFLGGFPLVALGLSTLMRFGGAKWRPIQCFVLAYIVVALASVAYPPPQLLFNHNEAYYRPEVHAANWAGAFFEDSTVIDSDHRMGVLLRYTVANAHVWLGNESSWLGCVSQNGTVYPMNRSLEYLVVTESMYKYGVIGDWTKPPKPLFLDAIRYLNDTPKIDRIYSNGVVTIYKNPRG